ncbi:MAG: histidine ammonia-lyase [Oligoflexales bacterium]
MDDGFVLGKQELTIEKLVCLGRSLKPKLKIDAKSLQNLIMYRKFVIKGLESSKTIYGVNTGFGYLSQVKIPAEKLQQLQLNLIRSHACGVGNDAPLEVVRSLLILRAHTFLLGHSGVSQECLNTIFAFLEHDLLPRIPMKGSVGASGDLAPLAHLALGLIGEGEIYYHGEKFPAKQALKLAGIEPLKPAAKEGLSLINGTHFMTSLGAYAMEQANIIAKSADIIATMSLDAIRGTTAAFDLRIQQARPHPGQELVARNILMLLEGDDQIKESHKGCDKVQDPYSFRCIPQVHGACRDTLEFVRNKVNIELNSVTDNPLIFEDGDLISGGNFHGQPIAMAMDFLAIAVAEFGSISERRIEKITNPNLSGLPAFVTEEVGLNSGYMIPHVVSAALASENKILCHPASIDSIPTSADKEDHVSMGPIAARKALEINENVASILAIELLASCQAIDLLKPLKPSPLLQVVYNSVRSQSPYMSNDRSLREDIEATTKMIQSGSLLELVADEGLKLN